MPELFRRHPLIAMLTALAVAFIVILGFETGWGTAFRPDLASTPPRRTAPFEGKLLPSLAATAAEQAYPETANRPLFTPTRRPAPPSNVASTTMQKGQYVLAGVIIVGDTKIAMLREKSSGKTHRLEKGQELNGIKLVEVDREKVTLSQGGDTEVLDLVVQKAQPAAAAAAAAAQAQPAGPFAGPAPGAAPRPPGPPGIPTATPATPQPAQPAAGGTDFGPHPPGYNAPTNPAARPPTATPQPQSQQSTDGATLTPEELLARRRARRTQQQNQ